MKKIKLLGIYLKITLGSFLLAVSLSCFLTPSALSAGGVGTIATVLFSFFGVPLSVTTLFINVILFWAGHRFLSRETVFRSFFGVLASSFFLALSTHFPVYTEDLSVAVLSGGLMMGIGLGLVVRQGASTGGTDFFALILKRFFPHLSLARLMLLIDCGIILFSGLLFRSVTATVYSAAALYLSMEMADRIISFGNAAKAVYILSANALNVSKQIQKAFLRGTTGIYSRGMYTEKDRLMLLSVVSPKELPGLIALIREEDPAAFIIISDVREVLGEGFR